MVIGDRIVVGEIKERQKARAIYEQARAERPEGGADRAGAAEHLHQLGRQYRPGRNRAGADRIPGAGAARPATSSRCACRWWSAPRYNPTPIVQTVDLRADGGGWGATTTDPVPDRDRISPPVLDPAEHAPVNPTTITVRLQAGFPLGEVKSHHHAGQDREALTARTRIIKLAEGPVPADRDFELTWKPAAEKAPSVGLFREHVGDADYLLAFVTPPAVEQAAAEAAAARSDLRDRQFRLDGRHVDGAGQGEPALRARPAAAGRPLQRDPLRRHHGRAVLRRRAGRRARIIARAKAFVDALQARGGTEMVPAMRAALTDRATRRRQLSCARWCSSPTARSATSSSCSTPSRRCADARACSWSASARRRTPS